MVRKPPDIMITTPESLHLMLTSRAQGDSSRDLSCDRRRDPRGLRQQARGLPGSASRTVAGDRYEARFVRIGLSATQRPLEEVARYLGGVEWTDEASSPDRAVARPVTIVDAGWRRDLDLQVIWPRRLDLPTSAGSIWPEIERELVSLVRQHRSTIIFANNRRTVEKLTTRLNELAAPDELEETDPSTADEPELGGYGYVSSPPWQHQPGRAEGDGRGAQTGGGRCCCVDSVTRARNRHGGGRSRLPGRVARQCGAGAATRGASGSYRQGNEQRAPDRQDAGRPARIGCALSRDESGPDRAITRAQELSRCPRPADRCVRGDGPVGSARTFRLGSPRLSFSQPLGRSVRKRFAIGVGAISHS